ncbi:hypothetical protein MMC34_003238 [Xylographa carneopallida]|nr:hypothetical protein [Xylographa carneopallida]
MALEDGAVVVPANEPVDDAVDDLPPDAGDPSTPHMRPSQIEDEAEKKWSRPAKKYDPYAIEVPPVSKSTESYPQLAAFAAYDPNFAIYRQFNTVRHRCLLYMQDELRALEHDLHQMDLGDHLSNRRLLFSRSREVHLGPARRVELIAQMKDKICEYDQMLRSTRDMMQWQSPTERNRRSYADHLVNTKPTVERESSFIGRADDLVSLAGDLQNGWLTSQTGQWIHDLWPNLAAAVFQNKVQTLLLADSKVIRLVDKARVNAFVRVVVTGLLIALLTAASSLALPIVQQAGYRSDNVVPLFTAAFAVLTALFTTATRGELFAAAVGYV